MIVGKYNQDVAAEVKSYRTYFVELYIYWISFEISVRLVDWQAPLSATI